tara:strand:- start:281 stop:481 length:201 start_codon:yes stop_codon:yes gene_type:complete
MPKLKPDSDSISEVVYSQQRPSRQLDSAAFRTVLAYLIGEELMDGYDVSRKCHHFKNHQDYYIYYF